MIYAIGICRSSGYGADGFRLIDTDTMKIMDVSYKSVYVALDTNLIEIQNMRLKEEGWLNERKDIHLEGMPSSPTEIWNGKVVNHRVLMALWKSSDGVYTCVDPRGFIHRLIEDELINKLTSRKIWISNCKFNEYNNSLESESEIKIIDIDEARSNEITGTGEITIKKYINKCKLLGIEALDIRKVKDEFTVIGASKDIKEVIIPNFVTRIEERSFSDCALIENIKLSNNLRFIGDSTFEGCTRIDNIEIPDTVEFIGDKAFHGCILLGRIDIPCSGKNLGMHIFRNCTRLKNVEFPSGIKEINKGLLEGCAFRRLKIPDTVEVIYKGAFRGCMILEHVELSNSLREIHESAFSFCSNLKGIVIPRSVKLIKEGAFYGCESLEDVVIEDKSNIEIKDIKILRVLNGR